MLHDSATSAAPTDASVDKGKGKVVQQEDDAMDEDEEEEEEEEEEGDGEEEEEDADVSIIYHFLQMFTLTPNCRRRKIWPR